MITHKDLWRAVDHLAACKGISMSALARSAGLDPTIFNRSKRGGNGSGKERWPSTESIAKVLNVTGVGMGDFGALVDQPGDDSAAIDGKAAAHYRQSAERVREEARFAPDRVLGEILADIAQRYDRLALWLETRSR